MFTEQGPTTSGRSVFKGAIRNTGIYFIPLLVQRASSFVLLPFTTRVLTTSDFGILSLLEQVAAVLSLIVGANFGSGLGFFYFEKDTQIDRRRVVGTAILGSM